MVSYIETDTRIAILLAGLMFLWALALGQIKYRQILASEHGHAHGYIDIAHRAALMYSFALVLIAAFVQLSAWSKTIDLIAVGVLTFYFVTAVGSYMLHGLRQDTENQLAHPGGFIRAYMNTLVIGEIGGFAVLFAGFVAAWIRG